MCYSQNGEVYERLQVDDEIAEAAIMESSTPLRYVSPQLGSAAASVNERGRHSAAHCRETERIIQDKGACHV
jgi:hypothetical protein